MCISYYTQTTFFYCGRFLKKSVDHKCFSITKGSIYHVKRMSIQPFTMGVDWPENLMFNGSASKLCLIFAHNVFLNSTAERGKLLFPLLTVFVIVRKVQFSEQSGKTDTFLQICQQWRVLSRFYRAMSMWTKSLGNFIIIQSVICVHICFRFKVSEPSILICSCFPQHSVYWYVAHST